MTQSETANFTSGAATWPTGRNIRIIFDCGLFSALCENMSSFPKPEVHNVIEENEPRAQVSCTKNVVLRHASWQSNKQTGKVTDIHTCWSQYQYFSPPTVGKVTVDVSNVKCTSTETNPEQTGDISATQQNTFRQFQRCRCWLRKSESEEMDKTTRKTRRRVLTPIGPQLRSNRPLLAQNLKTTKNASLGNVYPHENLSPGDCKHLWPWYSKSQCKSVFQVYRSKYHLLQKLLTRHTYTHIEPTTQPGLLNWSVTIHWSLRRQKLIGLISPYFWQWHTRNIAVYSRVKLFSTEFSLTRRPRSNAEAAEHVRTRGRSKNLALLIYYYYGNRTQGTYTSNDRHKKSSKLG